MGYTVVYETRMLQEPFHTSECLFTGRQEEKEGKEEEGESGSWSKSKTFKDFSFDLSTVCFLNLQGYRVCAIRSTDPSHGTMLLLVGAPIISTA